MHSTTNTTSTTTTSSAPATGTATTGASVGSNLGDKVKGAFQTVHGMGERLRGNALDAADSATGDRTTDAGHLHSAGTTKGAQNLTTDEKGRLEQEEGLARMHGSGNAAGTTGAYTTSGGRTL